MIIDRLVIILVFCLILAFIVITILMFLEVQTHAEGPLVIIQPNGTMTYVYPGTNGMPTVIMPATGGPPTYVWPGSPATGLPSPSPLTLPISPASPALPGWPQ